MGFPLLLYSLVLEKEEKILTLLKINGLDVKQYWISIYGFYMCLFTVTTTIFSILGWLFIDSTFFTKIPKDIITLFFLGWNLSQTSFGIFLSLIINESVYANMIGYITSVLMTLAFSGISFSIFPAPSTMPWYFFLIPHAAYIRFFYSATYDCVSGKCPKGLFGVLDMREETKRAFYSLYISAAFYALLSWTINHDKV